MKFEVTLELIIEAASVEDATDIGVGAAEHLVDTFNDDGSISPVVGVNTKRSIYD